MASSEPAPESNEPLPEAEAPYRNLWMPLVVVPGMIVVVLVLVFLAFGGIGGSEPSIDENLRVLVSGGANERTQAAFSLSQKIASNSRALLDGEEVPWPVPEDLGARVREAYAATSEGDPTVRFVLASLQAQLGDEQGVPHLVELLELPDSEDEDAQLRFQVLVSLGTSGDPRATPAVLGFADHPDGGLRSIVAIVLQKLPGEAVRPALEGLTRDPELEVRANAAISLAKLGDPAGAGVLLSLLDPEVYRAENEADRRRFRSGEIVSQSRRKGLEALRKLGRPADREAVLAWREDPDLEFRGELLDALERWGAE